MEVAYNPNYSGAPECKRDVLNEYAEWKAYAADWTDDTVFGARRIADLSKLNGLVGRANGLAKSCLPGFNASQQVRGVDVAPSVLSDIAEVAPGGGPAPTGWPVKPASLILAGVGVGLVTLGLAYRGAVSLVTPRRR